MKHCSTAFSQIRKSVVGKLIQPFNISYTMYNNGISYIYYITIATQLASLLYFKHTNQTVTTETVAG